MIRFIVVGQPRSGSTLLREGLAQHPGVKMFGELFHRLEEQRRRHVVRRDELTYYRGGEEDALAFLQHFVWERPDAAYQAVGFKLLSEYVQCAGTRELLPRLGAIPGLRVLDIARRNLLDMWVSRRKAEQSGIWREPLKPGKRQRAARPTRPIEVDAQALQRDLAAMEAKTAATRAAFAGLRRLEVDYDRLSDDFNGAMAEAFAFLSLEPHLCRMTIRKQNLTPHSEYIKNYVELKQFFARSSYAHFFVE